MTLAIAYNIIFISQPIYSGPDTENSLSNAEDCSFITSGYKCTADLPELSDWNKI